MWLRAFIIVALFPASLVRADARTDIQLLQRFQGSWQRHCYPSSDGNTKVYREDELIISYTHFLFSSKIYLDDRCNAERTHYSSKVRFVLTGEHTEYQPVVSSPVALPKHIYAINFYPEANSSAFFILPQRNIIAIAGMQLFLGRDYSDESIRGERLTKLDISAPFIRH